MPHSVSQPNDALPGPAPESQPPAARPTGKRVLVIDDDDAVRRSLSAILTARGYLTVEADGGPAALDTLRDSPAQFDAVILDHNMPGMNGREVLAALREMHPELPVVIASGFDVESAADAADARLRFVQKALGPRALLAQLGELLQPAA